MYVLTDNFEDLYSITPAVYSHLLDFSLSLFFFREMLLRLYVLPSQYLRLGYWQYYLPIYRLQKEEDNTSTQAPSKPRPLYDIPYMFEAREFLRKKLIGKKVRKQK